MPRLVSRCAWLVALASLIATAACMKSDTSVPAANPPTVTREVFGTLPSGDSVHLYTLTNAHGIVVRAMEYGGIIVSLSTPDRAGASGDIVLGYDSLARYLESSPYFGAIVGRYANRIAKGRFTVDGKQYTLATNNGANALHGGVRGFDKVLWKGEGSTDSTGAHLVLRYVSADGEEGYPGALTVQVSYTLTNRDEFAVDYLATTTKATPVNLSQHSYFNLAGTGDILGHQLTLDAAGYTPVDTTLIPTGVIVPVQGTPFDFRVPTAIGARIGAADAQLKAGGGYDHNWVLTREGRGLAHAARVEDPASGRTLDVATTEPGIQFYSGNFLDGTLTGKGGREYGHRSGLCLETQHFPDSPNQPGFPSTILKPGAEYRSRTVYTFGVAGAPRR